MIRVWGEVMNGQHGQTHGTAHTTCLTHLPRPLSHILDPLIHNLALLLLQPVAQ